MAFSQKISKNVTMTTRTIEHRYYNHISDRIEIILFAKESFMYYTIQILIDNYVTAVVVHDLCFIYNIKKNHRHVIW